MPIGNFFGRSKTDLQIGFEKASALNAVAENLQRQHDSITGRVSDGFAGPVGVMQFDNLIQVLEFVEKTEQRILALRASLDRIEQNKGQELSKIDSIVSKYVETSHASGGVEVTKEDDPDLLRYGVEACVRCEDKTLYWWRGGVMPLCQKCAVVVDENWCLDFAQKHKYGPL